MLFFAFFSISKKQNIKRNETFGIVIFQPNVTQETWTLLQAVPEEVTRVEGAHPPRRAPYLMGPLLLQRRTPYSYIYLRTPKRSDTKPKT